MWCEGIDIIWLKVGRETGPDCCESGNETLGSKKFLD